MGIGDAIVTVGCLAGFMVALPAILVFVNLAFIRISDRATARLSRGGIVPFFVGLIPILFIGVPSGFFIAQGSFLQFCGSILMLGLLFYGFLGLGVVARLAGQRLTALYDRDESPFIQTVAGSVVLSFSIVFPIIGWLVVLPFSIIIGTGAVLMATIGNFFGSVFGGNRRQQAYTAPRPVAPPPAEWEGQQP